MSDPCWSCRQRPPVLPDGRCETCGNARPESMPTLLAKAPPAPPAAPPPGAHAPTEIGAPPQPPTAIGSPPPGAYPQPGAYAQHPAYPPYPQGPGGPNAMLPPQFTSPKGLATAITVLLSVCMGTLVIALLASGNLSNVLNDIESGNITFNTAAEYDDANSASAGANLFVALLVLATGVVFIIWFHRIRTNAELFDPAGQRLSRGWAIGSWFTPVVNLWFPARIASNAWRSSTPYPESPRLVLVAWWWALWIATNVSIVISRLLAVDDGDEFFSSQEEYDEALTQAQSAVGFNILGSLLGIAAAILAMLFVLKMTRRQITKFEQGPMGAPPAPAPYGMPGMPGMPPPYGG
jgi:Domain of unknown function (DUF4328)